MNRKILRWSKISFVIFILFAVSFAFKNQQSFFNFLKAIEAAPAAKKKVNLAIWSNYITPELLNEFEKRTSIRVHVSHYSSNEELLAKLQAGASGYDVIVPSDYMVGVMIKLRLLLPMEKARLQSYSDLDPRFLGKNFDPQNEYSVPYDFGTTGIAINTSKYFGKLTGWKDLFQSKNLQGKFSVLDDMRETMGAALKSLGYSLNSKNVEQLEKAKNVLSAAKSRAKAFTSETLVALTNGEWPVAHAYVSDALQARKATSGKIEFIIPEEGGTIWIDNLAIPKGAKNLNESYELINYILEAKTNAATARQIFVVPSNKNALSLLPKEMLAIRSLFPTEEQLKKSEMIEDLGDSILVWDRIWTIIKATEVN